MERFFIERDEATNGTFKKMASYFQGVEKFKDIKEDHPYGVTYIKGIDDIFLLVYIDNEAWGSEAHIHLLTIVKKIIIPEIERR